MTDEPAAEDPRRVLAELRRSRRRRRTVALDPVDALYKVYVTAVLSGIALWLLSGVVGDHRVGPATVAHVRAHGAAAVGAVVAVAWAIGLRSGGRGGPLVIEAADVRHVLLSPVARSTALQPVGVRLLRFGAFVGAAVGAVGGLLAFRRLPGPAAEWVLSGAATAALAVLGALGLAMVVSGRRWGRVAGGLLAVAAVGWSAADLVTGSTTSPATWLGALALSPLEARPGAAIGAAVALACVAAGLACVGGCSIEAAESRATLVGQLRFAATLRDLRTVIVLRRQLAQELPRSRPWLRLRPVLPATWVASGTAVAGPGPAARFPSWRRGWHQILRFPALRAARLAVLGACAGAALVGAWRGTTPLLVLAALALYVAALDAVEPLAQELDHPDRRDAYPVAAGELYLRELGPPMVVAAAVGLVAWATAVGITGANTDAIGVGAVLVLPAAWCALAGAVISVVQGPPAAFSASDTFLPPETAGIRAVVRVGWPPVVALAGVLPILAARQSSRSSAGPAGPAAAAGAAAAGLLALLALVAVWLRYRDDIHAWFRTAMEEANQSRGARGGEPWRRRPTGGR